MEAKFYFRINSIKCKYIVNNVGWNPIYDIRSEGIKKDVQLNYKANIYQNTGIDWENVSVIISTGNPAQNNNRPILSSLYSRIYEGGRYSEKFETLEEQAPVTNMAITKSNKYVERSEISKNQLSIDFEILNKQTINSDGKENLVELKSYDLNTEYIRVVAL